MSYISVSQRQVAQRTGYIPVSQRRDVSSTQPIQPLVAFDFPRTAQASSPTAPSLFGMAKGTGQIAKTIGREIIRQPASVGVEISSRLDQLLGRPKIEQLAPSDFAKVPGLEKTARFLFGEEPVPSLDKRIAAGTEIAEKLGFEGAAAKAASGFFILGITGLDFLPFGGNVDDVVKALRAVNKAEDAAKILRTIGVAEDLIPEASIKFAKLTNSQEIKAGLETIAKTQQTTKFAKPKYVPVASRTLKTAPGEAIAPAFGEGEIKTRGLSLGVEAKAIEEGLTRGLGDLPEYQTINMADQAQKALDFVKRDYETSRRVAMGEELSPQGIIPEAVFKAIEDKALKENDIITIRNLATKSNLVTEATTMGQRIRTLAERNPDSPVSIISEIQKIRQEKYYKKYGTSKFPKIKPKVFKPEDKIS